MKFRRCVKRPIEVEFREVEGEEEVLTLENREGDSLIAKADEDFIIRGVKGELYPIKKEIFYQTYDIVEEGAE
ncbi:MAG: hypothetical protein KGD60_15020 [Candidatus Thorarchaeota archaeon]|nr:hypothetical protein [Candidatus Thorarchaeota archaeon]